jgi:glycine cleavage system aminomethyltransferase T
MEQKPATGQDARPDTAHGRCHYGLMLRDDGFIYDDGIVGRLA